MARATPVHASHHRIPSIWVLPRISTVAFVNIFPAVREPISQGREGRSRPWLHAYRKVGHDAHLKSSATSLPLASFPPTRKGSDVGKSTIQELRNMAHDTNAFDAKFQALIRNV